MVMRRDGPIVGFGADIGSSTNGRFGDTMLRTGDILGHASVSTADQDLSGQKDRFIQNGAVRVFEDVISGKTFNPPGLAALLDRVRPNDTLAVIRLDRLGRSLKEGSIGINGSKVT